VHTGFKEALASLDFDFFNEFDVFYDNLIDAFIALKKEEVGTLNMIIHPVEFEMYFYV
jgi:glutamine synthetase